ncbi:MAG: Ppx/GppA phosphatase family protein [Dehalococcoidia bacterium]
MPSSTSSYKPATVAVLDIGSNSCRLVIARLHPESGFEVLDEARAMLRLANEDPKAPIAGPTLARAEAAFPVFRQIADSYRPKRRVYVATSAVREAANRKDVARRFSDLLGHKVRVISAKDEAAYAVRAAVNSFSLARGTVIDLGGGSVQVAGFDGGEMKDWRSLPAGSLLLQRRFFEKGWSASAQTDLIAYVEGLLVESAPKVRLPAVFVGGTARALAKLHQRSYGYAWPWPHGYAFSLAQLGRLRKRLSELDLDERRRLPGMNADRADTILPGAIALERLCIANSIDRLVVSGEGVRHGVLYELLEERGLLAGDARSRSLASLSALASAPPYEEAALQLAARISAPPSPLESTTGEMLELCLRLHRIGDVLGHERFDRSAEQMIMSREMAGFTHRDALLIAYTLGSFGRFRLRRAAVRPPLHPDDYKLVEQTSALLQLTVALARAGGAEARVRWSAERLKIDTPTPPLEADQLARRLKSAFGVEVLFSS